MSTFFHASDLHFGRADPRVAEALLAEINRISPDMALLSGDFTQTGSRAEFAQARAFIQSLPCAWLAVPGNHDIPRHPWPRFTAPYGRYRAFIFPDLCPVYEDDQHFIVGLNTARAVLPHWNWAHGKISRAQLNHVRHIFEKACPGQWKILMCHHPLYEIVDSPIKVWTWRADELRRLLMDTGVHMVVTGHIHHASVAFEEEGNYTLHHIGAASAFSTRLRSQGNGYNLIRTNGQEAEIILMAWDGTRFSAIESHIIRQDVSAVPVDVSSP